MATESTGPDITLPAGVDLSTHQYKMVDIVPGTGRVILASVAGQRIIGVLQDAPAVIGQSARIRTGAGAITKMVSSGVIARGASLATTNVGTAATAALGNFIIGRALDAAVAGDIFRVLLQPNGTSP